MCYIVRMYAMQDYKIWPGAYIMYVRYVRLKINSEFAEQC